MKTAKYIFVIVFLLLAGLSLEAEKIILTGVEKSLALSRKQNISNIVYSLAFNIPDDKSEAVDGSLHLSLKLADKADLQLDFKSNRENIHGVEVNGKRCLDYVFVNEHICIPKRFLKKGNNDLLIYFTAGDKPLNRNDEYLYTLLVPDRARTLFPCFDQPDLKAEYRLTLEIPAGWETVSNTVVTSRQKIGNREIVKFGATEPLSSYLFSFVAGKFDKQTEQRGSRQISAYYRETDPKKTSQLPIIFNQIFSALDWLEDYTGIAYPFAKYDFIILPGFQFGGMEHTGATLYNDLRMWLGETPTLQEELDRALLIAHETSHMWFGDLVTMAWFDDVWTKEVFANYYSAEIAEPLFPDANHSLNRLRTFYAPALSEDRTSGATPIQQELTNLEYAGLVYNNIIYDKAPVMMAKLVDIMGKEQFRQGIREYLSKYAYSNATWDDLVDILDSHTDADLKQFCEVWVKAKGLPEISFRKSDTDLTVVQRDPFGRGLSWRQKFNVMLVGDSCSKVIEVEMASDSVKVPVDFNVKYVVPNTDGRGYAYFSLEKSDLDYMLASWQAQEEPLVRQTMVMSIYENYLNGKVLPVEMSDSFISGVARESDPLIAASLINYLEYVALHSEISLSCSIQQDVSRLARMVSNRSVSLQLMRMLARIMTDRDIIDEMYNQWLIGDETFWSSNDLMDLSYELAIRMPDRATEIIAQQRSRISNGDKLREFDFVSRACVADSLVRDSLFAELLTPEGRDNEAFAKRALAYLNHFTRNEESVKYIRPALEVLDEVRAKGDIFFPGAWCKALLNGHYGDSARNEVTRFLNDHPDYPQLLLNKILYAADPLFRREASR